MSAAGRETGASSVPIRVAIADDHPLYRDGLRTMVQSLPGMEFIGEAQDGVSAVELVQRLQPDVLLLDLEMPAGGGLEALRTIHALDVPTAVLVITMHEDDNSVVAAIAAGARGYLSKSADRNELERAIAAAPEVASSSERASPDGWLACSVARAMQRRARSPR